MNISKNKLNDLSKILLKDYGVVFDNKTLSEFAEKILRMTLLAKKHYNVRLVGKMDGLQSKNRRRDINLLISE